jgi:hypothetical protein
MDYFYNSSEFSSRAKLSDKEKDSLIVFIFSILSIYNDVIDNKVDHKKNKFINENYLLNLGVKYLNDRNLQKNEYISYLHLIDKIGKNYILSGNYRGLEFLKKIIILDTIICIEGKKSIFILKEKLLSICGEKFRKEYLIRELNIKESNKNG